jgi:hypothetical protein
MRENKTNAITTITTTQNQVPIALPPTSIDSLQGCKLRTPVDKVCAVTPNAPLAKSQDGHHLPAFPTTRARSQLLGVRAHWKA